MKLNKICYADVFCHFFKAGQHAAEKKFTINFFVLVLKHPNVHVILYKASEMEKDGHLWLQRTVCLTEPKN